MLSNRERQRFDSLLEEAIEQLPPALRDLIDEVPVVALDRPTDAMLRDLGIDPADEEEATSLCGLHSGVSNTERSVERSGDLPSDIHLFREGIISLAGGFDQPEADDVVYEEIMITLLHEIGHEFGLDEDDLERLGYA
ncbi:MAG: metallopeptidase family protein [Phycisphaerae bacterium]|nr:metallopeptidase family protein [Phycisphaerae bacterium]MBN8598097.1 metallopeptidase family protein [Planctomycetota bacterium]